MNSIILHLYKLIAFAALLSAGISSCSKNCVTLAQKYNSNVTYLEFRDFGINNNVESEFYLNFSEDLFEIVGPGKFTHSGMLPKAIKDEIIASAGALSTCDVDRIYNANSADASLFQVRFWGDISSFGYTIETYGNHVEVERVKRFINVIRRSLKALGASKENDVQGNESIVAEELKERIFYSKEMALVAPEKVRHLSFRNMDLTEIPDWIFKAT